VATKQQVHELISSFDDRQIKPIYDNIIDQEYQQLRRKGLASKNTMNELENKYYKESNQK